MTLTELATEVAAIVVNDKGNIVKEALDALAIIQQIQTQHGNIEIGFVPLNAPDGLKQDLAQLQTLLNAAGINIQDLVSASYIKTISGFGNIIAELKGDQAVVGGSLDTAKLPSQLQDLLGFQDRIMVYLVRHTAAPNGLQPIVVNPTNA